MMTSDHDERKAPKLHVNTTQMQSFELPRSTARALNTAPTHTLFGPLHDPYSESVADWNLGQRIQVKAGALRASLDTRRQQGNSFEEGRRHSLSHKRNVSDLGQTEATTSGMGFFKRSHDKERKRKSSSAEKPLPVTPNGNGYQQSRIAPDSSQGRNTIPERPARPSVDALETTPEIGSIEKDKPSQLHNGEVHSELGRERGYLVKDSEHAVDLTGIVDLSHSEDTDLTVTYAPHVTHETRHINTHEIIQKEITREIHNHHIYHRTLPVLDFEVLPAKHYVPHASGGLIEIPEHEIPGGAAMSQHVHQIISSALINAMPQASQPSHIVPRRFTARKFQGTEGDYKEWIGEDGIKRTEQWWVHPPTIAKPPMGDDEPSHTYHFHWVDRSKEEGQNGNDVASKNSETASEGDVAKSGMTPLPPPRGASLGKTTMPLPAGGANADLPIRTVNSGGAGSGSGPAEKTGVVGAAY